MKNTKIHKKSKAEKEILRKIALCKKLFEIRQQKVFFISIWLDWDSNREIKRRTRKRRKFAKNS